jgi:hypothetical protein
MVHHNVLLLLLEEEEVIEVHHILQHVVESVERDGYDVYEYMKMILEDRVRRVRLGPARVRV